MYYIRLTSRFQSTLPRGERPAEASNISDTLKISIHAPAWGATCGDCINFILKVYFNPRSRVGSDIHKVTYHKRKQDFNPRSRVGSDAKLVSVRFTALAFQSTLPRGERLAAIVLISSLKYISIHAPAWGATFTRSPTTNASRISIHAPAWGATA